MPTPSQNGPLFVYFDVHYDKLYYKTQYLLRSTHITRNTIEDCAGNGSWKCATESKLPSSKDLESLGERRRRRNKIITNLIRRGGRRKQNKKRKKTRRKKEEKEEEGKKERAFFWKILFFWFFFEILRQTYVHLARAWPNKYIYIYIYIYAGELVLVPLFWPFDVQEQYHIKKNHSHSSQKQIKS